MTRVAAHLTDKQKRNIQINGQKNIKSYNTPTFIPNGYKIVKVNIYTHNEGQRPIKRHKEPEQRYATLVQHIHYNSLAKQQFLCTVKLWSYWQAHWRPFGTLHTGVLQEPYPFLQDLTIAVLTLSI